MVEFGGLTDREKYYWIEDVLMRFRQHVLKRDEKRVIRQYIKGGYGILQVKSIEADSGVQS